LLLNFFFYLHVFLQHYWNNITAVKGHYAIKNSQEAHTTNKTCQKDEVNLYI